MNEFDLIDSFFNVSVSDQSVIQSIGDDAAVLTISNGCELVTSTDILISGVHFPTETSPIDIAYKSAMVAISDLAAMGAIPKWCLLSLSLPNADEEWLQSFSKGFFEALEKCGVLLVGGDTCRSPLLSITVQVFGEVEAGKAILRKGAKPGETVYISGPLGLAGLGLQRLQAGQTVEPELLAALNRPNARVTLGRQLQGKVSSMVDISDGLIADCRHIAHRSGVGIELDAAALPIWEKAEALGLVEECRTLALTAGDDYELCFTAAPGLEKEVSCFPVGQVIAGSQVIVNNIKNIECSGYQHF